MRIGIDAGGTFTDFVVAARDGSINVFKLRSDPADPASVILDGISRVAGGSRAEVVHGSTVATNALLQRRGARTALITTKGFEDVIEIGRQNRPHLYALNPEPPVGISERTLRFGVPERTYFDGTVAGSPSEKQLRRLRNAVERAKVESIAICFLHSYREPRNEQLVADALKGLGYVCCSHEICPEFREYERTTTTFLNGYVGPLMDRYLARLAEGNLPRLWVMQSNGGLMSSDEARHLAVRTLLSGPAGGVVGALETAKQSGLRKVLALDMGGTSTDVSLCEDTPRLTSEAYIDGFPVRVPMLDIQTVGAGGGSLARVDAGGLLRVGPESAGAEPGPACYGTGTQGTVTDAHVVLGRIQPEQFLAGEMPIYPDRASAAVDKLARALRITRKAAAQGIVRVANANMERAIRAISVERGHDPRDFALVAFGGCGGLHACEISEDLGIRTVIVPAYAGVLSAVGMLMAPRMRDYSAGVIGRSDLQEQFALLEKRARADIPKGRMERYVDMRYTGQSYELTIPAGASFDEAHQRLYGYSDPGRSTETVTARVRAVQGVPSLRISKLAQRPLHSVFVPTGWKRRVDATGNSILTR